MDLEMVKLLSNVCAFCEEEKHAIMNCPFVPFHIKVGIVKGVELQNLAGTLMYQPQEQEPIIFVIQNKWNGMELGG